MKINEMLTNLKIKYQVQIKGFYTANYYSYIKGSWVFICKNKLS